MKPIHIAFILLIDILWAFNIVAIKEAVLAMAPLLTVALRYAVVPVQKALFGQVLADPESLRMLIFGLALILVMRFKPAGLWPSPERRRELSENTR